jgi:hypothetical protein
VAADGVVASQMSQALIVYKAMYKRHLAYTPGTRSRPDCHERHKIADAETLGKLYPNFIRCFGVTETMPLYQHLWASISRVSGAIDFARKVENAVLAECAGS